MGLYLWVVGFGALCSSALGFCPPLTTESGFAISIHEQARPADCNLSLRHGTCNVECADGWELSADSPRSINCGAKGKWVGAANVSCIESGARVSDPRDSSYFVNFSLSVSSDVPNGTVFTLDPHNTMLISSRVNGESNCGKAIVATHPARVLVVNSSEERTITYSINKITLTEVKNSHPVQWRNCLFTSYVAYKHELTGTVLRVQTQFTVGYSVYDRATIRKYDLTTCRTVPKAKVGFTFARKAGKGSLVKAELAVPGNIERSTCYKL